MTNNKQQTAVDSIIAKLNNVKPSEFCSIETIKEWCEQAKAIEKTQLISCYVIADCRCNKEHAMKEAEHFYNLTYGGNK
jgi:hypothetical protein